MCARASWLFSRKASRVCLIRELSGSDKTGLLRDPRLSLAHTIPRVARRQWRCVLRSLNLFLFRGEHFANWRTGIEAIMNYSRRVSLAQVVFFCSSFLKEYLARIKFCNALVLARNTAVGEHQCPVSLSKLIRTKKPAAEIDCN